MSQTLMFGKKTKVNEKKVCLHSNMVSLWFPSLVRDVGLNIRVKVVARIDL